MKQIQGGVTAAKGFEAAGTAAKYQIQRQDGHGADLQHRAV